MKLKTILQCVEEQNYAPRSGTGVRGPPTGIRYLIEVADSVPHGGRSQKSMGTMNEFSELDFGARRDAAQAGCNRTDILQEGECTRFVANNGADSMPFDRKLRWIGGTNARP